VIRAVARRVWKSMLLARCSRYEKFLGGSVLVAVAAAIAAGMAMARAPERRRPGADDVVLARVPATARDPRARERRALERRAPADLEGGVRLARLEIDEARRTGDPRPLGYAEAALAPWWADPGAPPPVLLLRATIRQSRHDFSGALADLDRLVLQAPDEPQAWLTRAVVLAVRGRYPEARASCAGLEPLVSPVVTAACRAPLDGLTGQLSRARRTLAAALATAAAGERGWITSLLGELALWAGDVPAAERHLAEALRLDPDDRYSRATYADLLLDAGRAREAAALVAGREADDGMLLRRVLAEAALGSAVSVPLATTLRERFAATRRRGDATHQREEARLVLAVDRQPGRALTLAAAGWQQQHEPWDARLLLEAARASGHPEAAAPARAWLAETGFENPRLRALAAEVHP
jgi:tetratricopeptide (TPR) repeat protein